MTFEIRDAVAADMDALRDVYRRAALSNESDRVLLLANPDCLEFSDVAVSEGRTRAAVLADGHIIGFASTVPAPGAIELEDLFVDPDWMRHGVGRALVRDVVAMARMHGTGRLEVTANQDAFAFYQKVGFVFDHDVETRFRPAPRMHIDLVP